MQPAVWAGDPSLGSESLFERAAWRDDRVLVAQPDGYSLVA